MRSIPAELKARIEKAQQTLYENADPHMNIFVYNSRWNELFTVYTVHNKPNIDRIDVTAKREMASTDPNKLYAIYIEDGASHVISKSLPYNELIPWDAEFTVGAASDVAIEFNGYWERDQISKRFNFIAHDKPWIFKQNAGSLTAQYWQDAPLTLATGVGRICTMRGWLPAQADHTQDQGLIVVYLKSGIAYYRNYCLQSDGTTYLWEAEQQITTLPTGLTDIALFRTNDFRVGVLGRDSSGQVHMTVTVRNWTGMSVWPENLQADINKREMEYCHVDVPDPTVSAERVGESCVSLTFNLPLTNIATSKVGFSLMVGSEELTITAIEGAEMGTNLLISYAESLPSVTDIVVLYDDWRGNLRTYATQYCRRYVNTFEIVALGLLPQASDETLTCAVTGEVDLLPILKIQGYLPSEEMTANITAELEFLEIDKIVVEEGETYAQEDEISAVVTGQVEFWHVDLAPV